MILCGFGVGIAILTSASPYLIGNSINLYLASDSFYLYALAGASIFIIAITPIKLAANIYLQKTASQTRFSLKKTILTHVLNTSFGPTVKPGERIELIDGDVDGSMYLYHSLYFDISLNCSIIIVALLITSNYHPLLALAPLSGLLYASIAYLATRKRSNSLYTAYVKDNTVIVGAICEHLYDSKPYTDRIKLDIKNIERLAFRSSLKASTFESISGSCYPVAIVVLFFVSAHLLSVGDSNIGSIFASAIYLERVLSPTMSMISIYYSSREASYRRSRIRSYELQHEGH
ncbi:hypothetical protein HU727_010010 [Pseudomonas sp. SWRI153]|uniref:ABC transporter ATP-binding protein n=1 Tax=Pseudomonas khorasanensis TaxID=2745508 RepID=A0A923F2S2_9PSED|nr:hypothetical protein [Pseudomonas khorasanensis]